jgi:hypothetical protein
MQQHISLLKIAVIHLIIPNIGLMLAMPIGAKSLGDHMEEAIIVLNGLQCIVVTSYKTMVIKHTTII